MPTHYHYHYRGNPGPSTGDKVIGSLVLAYLVAVVVAAVIYIVGLLLAIAVTVALVSGLGYLSYRLTRNATMLTSARYRYATCARRVRSLQRRHMRVAAKVQTLSPGDQELAFAPIVEKLRKSGEEFLNARENLITRLQQNIASLHECRTRLLARADSKSEKRLVNALAKIDNALLRTESLIADLQPKQLADGAQP